MKIVIETLIVLVAVIGGSGPLFAQAAGEYGRIVGGVGPQGSGIGKTITPGRTLRDTSKLKSVKIPESEARKLPAALTVSASSTAIYSRSEDWADKIAEVSLGEKLVPLLHSTGATAAWYMVKNSAGVMGWIKATDVVPDDKAR